MVQGGKGKCGDVNVNNSGDSSGDNISIAATTLEIMMTIAMIVVAKSDVDSSCMVVQIVVKMVMAVLVAAKAMGHG